MSTYTTGPHAGQSEFRETLVRDFGRTTGDTLCICMQNPSRAEEFDVAANDPTVLRCIGFTKRLGFGRLVVVNTYPRRSTDPKELYRWLYAMERYDRAVVRIAATAIVVREALAADMFIAAWGNGDGKDTHPWRIAKALEAAGVHVYAFGQNANGTPKHPLARGRNRIPDDAKPFLWRKGRAVRLAPMGAEGE